MLTDTKVPNRLIHEKSPYLLQHAHNPVDWFPWGEEAFAKAKAEDKPVFLSIGYSACHWCHVMEREVFEREEAAKVLNRDFVSIKADREERPDVDHVYMESCIAMTGGGGWPLTIFMTPDKRPFFAGTYFPMQSLITIANNLSRLWREDRRRLLTASDEIIAAVSRQPRSAEVIDKSQITHDAVKQLKSSFDNHFGGFGHAPKFPSAHTLMFLQRYALRHRDTDAGGMARHTLSCMAQGGLRDHVGGGFFRYSTDREYLIPHFEKMLYDNAMLAIAYAEQGYAEQARQILGFCERELKAPEGAYYTALDADSEGEEGKYYVFTLSEITGVLGETDSSRYSSLYDITQKGNFEGKNLPNLIKTKALSTEDEIFARGCHERLLGFRSRRVRPMRDEKLLLSSNSLMLAALATCGRLLREPEYTAKAAALAEFMLTNMRRGGRMYAVYMGALSEHPATSDDYAYLVWGLYRLHQAALDGRWLNEARDICDDMLRLFADTDGLLYLSGSDVSDLPLRVKNTQDGALPCGNSIAAGVLLRLHTLTGDEKYHSAYVKLADAMASRAAEYPTAHTSFLSALVLSESELRVELPLQKSGMRQVTEDFYPFASFLPGAGEKASVCTSGACLPPVQTADELRETIVR